MKNTLSQLKEFFEKDRENPTASVSLLESLNNDSCPSSSVIMHLEKTGVSPEYKEKLIDALKAILYLTNKEDLLVRVINQLSFTLTDIKIK